MIAATGLSEMARAMALELAFSFQGYYSSHPADPDGPHKYGVTDEYLGDFRRLYPDATHIPREVIALQLVHAREIFTRLCWEPMHCQDMPPAVAFCLFETAIHCGRMRSVQWLQHLLGVHMDGRVGPETLAGIRRTSSLQLVTGLLLQRSNFYHSRPHWPDYRTSWTRRLLASGFYAGSINSGVYC